jgi:light-regulated signal transduction histidine kinase (bacteriophytochrome)
LNSQDEYEGNGPGLEIVQRIIQRHDGRIWAEADVNEGLLFISHCGIQKSKALRITVMIIKR